MLLVVLEWLKYRAFHIRTVYIHSLDPGRGIPSFVMPLTWSVGLFWKVCASRINYLEISWFLHYPLNVWSHIFTGCSQGGKVTFGNTLSTFKSRVVLYKYNVQLSWVNKISKLSNHFPEKAIWPPLYWPYHEFVRVGRGMLGLHDEPVVVQL